MHQEATDVQGQARQTQRGIGSRDLIASGFGFNFFGVCLCRMQASSAVEYLGQLSTNLHNFVTLAACASFDDRYTPAYTLGMT